MVSHGELCPSVTVREVAGGGVCLAGAKEKEVTTYAEMAAVLNKGTLCRATSATSMNACSSRSHAIFTITLEQRRRVCPQAKAPEDSRIGGEEVRAPSWSSFVQPAGCSQRLFWAFPLSLFAPFLVSLSLLQLLA